MFRFDVTDIQRFAISLIGALILSAACIVGAAGPVRAENASDHVPAASTSRYILA